MISKNGKHTCARVVSAFLSLFVGQGLVAQDAQSSAESQSEKAAPALPGNLVALEEVIVTARRRAESLQTVPIAIQAFSGDDLVNRGIQSSSEVLLQLSNATVADNGGAKQNFFIRGVGTQDIHLNMVSAVGVYLDDTILNSPFAVTFSTFDTERVEVLRGPQNTLFGRNTTGGAMNFISRKPDLAAGLQGHARAGYGSHDEIDLEGAVGFPLGENAAARIAVSSLTADSGFQNQTLGGDAASTQRQAGRGQVLWEPTQDLTLMFNIHGGVARNNPLPFKGAGLLDPVAFPAPCSVPANSIHPETNPDCVDASGSSFQTDDWENTFNNREHKEDVDAWGGSLRIEWNVGAVVFTSLTAFDSFKVAYAEDSDAGPSTLFNFNQEGNYDQWSQELRLQSADDQRMRWIGGFYWFFEDADFATAIRRVPRPLAPSGPNNFNTVPNTIVHQEDEAYSMYGEIEYDLQERLTATVGLRWTHESKQGVNSPSVRCVGPVGGPPFCPAADADAFFGFDEIPNLPALVVIPDIDLDFNSDDWGPSFALAWQGTESAMVYGSISRGFKSGGFNLGALAALTGTAGLSVETESLWAYEIGTKTAWLDNTLQLNAALFYYDWTDLQAFQVTLNSGGLPLYVNVPESSVLGAELELNWAPAEGWFLQSSVGWMDGEVDDAGDIVGVTKGNDLLNTPEFTFTGLLRKEFPFASGTLALQTNWRYQSEMTSDLGNAPNLGQLEGTWNLGARGSYRFGDDGKYEIAVWGKNLTGDRHCMTVASLEGVAESINCTTVLSEPTFGISGSINFY